MPTGVADAERQQLLAHVEDAVQLPAVEHARLRANLDWLMAMPPSLGQLRKRFELLTEDQKHALGRMAIAVAATDGAIDPEEVKAVQNIYRAMGLPEDHIFADLHAVSAVTSVSQPVMVRPADAAQASGYLIPRPPDAGRQQVQRQGLSLDRERILAIAADTVRVSRVLGEALAMEDSEGDEAEADAPAAAAPMVLERLDPAHRPLVEELTTRRSWPKVEFAELASHFGLMTEGARETINEWAFECFDDALLEEGAEIEVNLDVAARVNAKTTGERNATA